MRERERRRVAVDHVIPERPPLQVEPGQRLGVGDRDTEWPAFVFVTTDTGSGWVPSRHLHIDGSTALVRVGYDTTELPATVGEELEIVLDDPESGWAWCRAGDGREGWVPHRALA